MKKGLLVAVTLLAAGLMAVPAQVFALGGPHATFTCNNCHIPHAAGGDRLWIDVPSGVGNWGANKIGQLCYSCHDGTSGGSNMANYAYDNASHGPSFAAIPAEPDGPAASATPGATALNASTLPYSNATNPLTQSGGRAIQCTSCHFVHDETDSKRPYLRTGTGAAGYRGDLCERCHMRGEIDTAAEQGDNNEAAGYNVNISLHPIQIAATVPTQGASMVAALAVSSAGSPNMGNPVPAAGSWTWNLGGKTDAGGATGVLDCNTCHAVHGDETAGSGGQGLYILAINNFPTNYATSALCNGCHNRPVVTLGGDHPIDTNTGAYTVNFPTNGGPNHGSALSPWPAGTAANNTAVCSSCHDAHGGLPADASTNQGNVQTGRLRRTMGNATNWCYSCHGNASPNNHHSHEQNLAVAQGDNMTSVLGCEDCHSAFAHNTPTTFFATLDFDGAGGGLNHAASGVWCNYCHNSNPTDLEGSVAQAAVATITGMDGGLHERFPRGHGVDRGESSHVLGTDGVFTFGPQNVVVTVPRTAAWPAPAANPVGGSIDGFADNLSRYGLAAATSTATAALTCESCHNIIGNIGYNVVPLGKAGWQNNLLLMNYQDDGTGNRAGAGGAAVGSRFCMECHYGATAGTTGPPGTHQITGQVITAAADNQRPTTTLITGAGSYADAAGTPNTASYPADNQMDCDSCHRPHDAAPSGTITPSTPTYSANTIVKGVDFILEEANAGAGYSPTLCVNCHNY